MVTQNSGIKDEGCDLLADPHLIDGEWYSVGDLVGRWDSDKGLFYQYGDYPRRGFGLVRGEVATRLGPVAEYRQSPAEPTGIGAVVKDETGLWVRIGERSYPWVHATEPISSVRWGSIRRPFEILSAGVES